MQTYNFGSGKTLADIATFLEQLPEFQRSTASIGYQQPAPDVVGIDEYAPAQQDIGELRTLAELYDPRRYGFPLNDQTRMQIPGGRDPEILRTPEEEFPVKMSALVAPQNGGFQSMGKYATPQEFLERDPTGFAAANPDMVGTVKPRTELEKMQNEVMTILKTPVIGPMGRIDEQATAQRKQAAFQMLQDMEASKQQQTMVAMRAQGDAQKRAAEIAELEARARMHDRDKTTTKPTETTAFGDAWRIYEAMPEGAMKESFGAKFGLTGAANVKLKPGERFNPRTNEVELVPGSEAWRKQKAADEKSLEEQQALSNSFSEVARRISDLEKGGYASATGWWDAMVPVWTSLTPSNKADARSKIANLQEYLQTKGLLDLRKSGVAPGSVTEREWSKFAAMIGNIDPSLSDEAFGKELARVKTIMEEFKATGGTAAPSATTARTVTMQDIMDTAKATGKSVEQVKRDAEAKGFVVR